MSKKCIDVSEYQAPSKYDVGKIVKDKGYSGVIIRSGSGVGMDDEHYKTHVANAKKHGVNYGFYHYGYIGRGSENTSKTEADYFIKLVKPYYYDGIVLAYDLEESCTKSANDVYDFCYRVQKVFPKAYVMIYTNGNHYNRLGLVDTKYAIWFAKPDNIENNNTGINIALKQHHFGEHGGTLGDLDLNVDYKDVFNILKPKKNVVNQYSTVHIENNEGEYPYIMRQLKPSRLYNKDTGKFIKKSNGEYATTDDLINEYGLITPSKYIGKTEIENGQLRYKHRTNSKKFGICDFVYKDVYK